MAIRTNSTATAQGFANAEPFPNILSMVWSVVILLIALCRSALSLALDFICSRIHIKLVIKCEIQIGRPYSHNERRRRSVNVTGDPLQGDNQTNHVADEEEEEEVGIDENAGADPGVAPPLLGSLFGILGN